MTKRLVSKSAQLLNKHILSRVGIQVIRADIQLSPPKVFFSVEPIGGSIVECGVALKNTSINDLPKCSLWVERLLGLTPFSQAKRDIEMVDSEYDKGLYAELLTYYQARPQTTPEEVRDYYEGCRGKGTCISRDGKLYLTTDTEAIRLDKEETVRRITSVISSTAVVELGCGYGHNLYLLSQARLNGNTKYIGGDYSRNGVELANQLYKGNDNISVVPFNFYDKTWDILEELEERVLIFTHHSIEQLPQAKEVLLTFRKYRKKIDRVIHLEPVPELTDDGTLLGLMRMAYARLNDYNTDLLSAIANAGGVITRTEPDIIGANPLNPTSFVEWKYM